jgi:hypothetical protein
MILSILFMASSFKVIWIIISTGSFIYIKLLSEMGSEFHNKYETGFHLYLLIN